MLADCYSAYNAGVYIFRVIYAAAKSVSCFCKGKALFEKQAFNLLQLHIYL
jgi:hypothetical protein